MTAAIQIVAITADRALAYRDALDVVAREGRYLRLTRAPAIESTLAFVASNIERGNPHLVALADNAVIGWCDICRAEAATEHHVGNLGMGLVPGFRGRGIGTLLLRETMARAEAAGMYRISLEVFADNGPAIRLYAKCGFVEEGRLRRAVRLHEDYCDVLMMARLAFPPEARG